MNTASTIQSIANSCLKKPQKKIQTEAVGGYRGAMFTLCSGWWLEFTLNLFTSTSATCYGYEGTCNNTWQATPGCVEVFVRLLPASFEDLVSVLVPREQSCRAPLSLRTKGHKSNHVHDVAIATCRVLQLHILLVLAGLCARAYTALRLGSFLLMGEDTLAEPHGQRGIPAARMRTEAPDTKPQIIQEVEAHACILWAAIRDHW
eukprot:3917609-Amphidinium_carterae.9